MKSVYNQELSSENLPQFVLGTISKLFVLFHAQQMRTHVDVLYTWCPLKSSLFIQHSINVTSLTTSKKHSELSVCITLYYLEGLYCFALHCSVLYILLYEVCHQQSCSKLYFKEVFAEEVQLMVQGTSPLKHLCSRDTSI